MVQVGEDEIAHLMEQLELARATGPAGVAGPAGVPDWFKLTTPPVAPLPEEHECALCLMPRDGAALGAGDNGDAPPGTEVWVRNGVLSFKARGGDKEERIDVVWEGDENAPSGEPAAVRPCDMHGFIKVVLGRVKFRVQLAPTFELALEKNNKLYGCSFENPRLLEKGVPLVPAWQNCNCCFHRSCIRAARGLQEGSNCPIASAIWTRPLCYHHDRRAGRARRAALPARHCLILAGLARENSEHEGAGQPVPRCRSSVSAHGRTDIYRCITRRFVGNAREV